MPRMGYIRRNAIIEKGYRKKIMGRVRELRSKKRFLLEERSKKGVAH